LVAWWSDMTIESYKKLIHTIRLEKVWERVGKSDLILGAVDSD
jgi:hypothetical protein